MVRNGVRPDLHTFPFVLKVCADKLRIRKGLEIHGVLIKLGFDLDVFVGNTLLLFYGNCEILMGVRRVFDDMTERDIVPWNTVIAVFSVHGHHAEALDFFFEMIAMSGFRPNVATVASVLPVCAGLEDEVMRKQSHSYAVKVGLDYRVNIGNALVDMCGKCGNVIASRQIFGEMPERNEVSWNAIITSLACFGHNEDGLDMFKLTIHEKLKPNSVTISTLLPMLVELGLFNLGKEIHGLSIRFGIDSDLIVANSLIDMCAKSSCSDKPSDVFHQMPEKNVVFWSAMVANYAQNRIELEALNLVRQMQVEGEFPNSVTFTNVLPACTRLGLLHPGREIHARTIRTGSSSDLFISNALTDMYVICGCLNIARNVFKTSSTDEVSYNILIEGYSQTTNCSESLRPFLEMSHMGMKHDIVSYMGKVVSSCANLAALKHGKEIHGLVVRKHLHTGLFIASSLLDLYIKCGQIEVANKVFDRILKRDTAFWNTMILGYGMLGELKIAIDLFEAMKEDGVQYDSF